MKRYACLLSAIVLFVLTLPAHAVSNPDFTVNKINGTFRSNSVGGNATANGVGGGTGTGGGTGLGEICNASPENATVLLALLSGVGLLAGSRMRRMRVARVAIS